MTIRQYLVRRCYRTMGGLIVFLMVAGILVTAGPRIFVLRFVFSVLMGVIVLAALWSLFEVPCPNCRKSLGRIGFRVANGQMANSSPVCPHCGISLNAPMPGNR